MVGARNKQAVRNKPVAHSKPAVHKPGEEALVVAEVGARIQAEAGVVVRIRAVVVGIRVAGEVRIQEEASLEMPMVLPWHQQASPFH